MKKYEDTGRWYEELWQETVENENDGEQLLNDLRRKAIESFKNLDFPTRKDEEWKYTPVDPLLKMQFKPASQVVSNAGRDAFQQYLYDEEEFHTLIFINGQFREDFSKLPDDESGLIVMGLKEAITRYTDDIEQYLNRFAPSEENIFTALGTAFINDGVFIKVPDNKAASKPLQILYYTDAQEEVLTSPRNLILLGKNAELKFVEIYAGSEKAHYFTNMITEISLQENASCEHIKVQKESGKAFHISSTSLKQKKTSSYKHFELNVGGLIVRNDIDTEFLESGSECSLFGVSVQHGKQLIDNHTFIDHAVPHCESHEMYKTVLHDDARGVFSGKVMVRKDAQKTNAFQENKTILLSDRALMNAKPQLEIYADDVKCSHGATIGQLDKEAMFYLQSRGFDKQLARIVLINAFAADIVNQISIESLREKLADDIAALLSDEKAK